MSWSIAIAFMATMRCAFEVVVTAIKSLSLLVCVHRPPVAEPPPIRAQRREEQSAVRWPMLCCARREARPEPPMPPLREDRHHRCRAHPLQISRGEQTRARCRDLTPVCARSAQAPSQHSQILRERSLQVVLTRLSSLSDCLCCARVNERDEEGEREGRRRCGCEGYPQLLRGRSAIEAEVACTACCGCV